MAPIHRTCRPPGNGDRHRRLTLGFSIPHLMRLLPLRKGFKSITPVAAYIAGWAEVAAAFDSELLLDEPSRSAGFDGGEGAW
jgi:hypothetical protein